MVLLCYIDCVPIKISLTIAPKQAAMNAPLDALHPPARIVARTPSTKLPPVIRPCKLAWKDFGKPEKKNVVYPLFSVYLKGTTARIYANGNDSNILAMDYTFLWVIS